MSNTAVGQVYNRVVEAVIESSRTDFEEWGVRSDVLENLQDLWQKNLTQAQRALFPWDPQPTEPDPEPTQPSASTTEPPPEPAPSTSPAVASNTQSNGNNDVQVKQEQQVDNGSFLNLPQQNYTSGLGSQYASQRAAHLLQQQFGSQASGSIGALQAAGMRQQSSEGQSTSQQGSDQKVPLKQETSPQVPHVKQENAENGSLGQAQTDGAGDAADEWTAVVMRRNARGDHEPMGRLAVDGIIRRHVAQMAQRLEGGGLMVPLDERYPKRRSRRTVRHAERSFQQLSLNSGEPASSENPGLEDTECTIGRGGFDGPDDSDVDDDAINSDLDDPDETADNDIEGVYDGDVILCLYDKVQRVKNKWKCVLKDGVVTVDGKDYVFHKASGEFEW